MKQSKAEYDLIVVGGGASGLMAAGRAAELGKKVLLLEKNRKVGEKLKITGGGRCNITNAEYDTQTLLKAYGKSEQFLYSLFSQFGVEDTFTFFESKGLPLIVEDRKRAFPKTEKAEDVLNVLKKYVEDGGVTIKTNTSVTKINTGKKGEEGGIESVVAGGKGSEGETYRADNFIISTGGVSHPETGSTGDGLSWLKGLGHTISESTPTIVPLAVSETWAKKLTGISIPNMKITFFVEGKKAFSVKGEILFTHFGVSGPLILNNAHKVADLLHSGIVTAEIDMYPQTDLGALDSDLVALFDKNKNKAFKNAIKEFVPEGMSKGLIPLLTRTDSVVHLDIEKKVHSISREERKFIVNTLKTLPLTIKGLMGFDRAVVADGGVAIEEIDMRSMRSKKVSNLYITGDLLHIKRPSGGFSLQLCWTSGYVAGSQ